MNIQSASSPNPESQVTQPLEPGRPDVMPNPIAPGVLQPSTEGQQPLIPDDGVSEEEDMVDVEINNLVSEENPPQH